MMDDSANPRNPRDRQPAPFPDLAALRAYLLEHPEILAEDMRLARALMDAEAGGGADNVVSLQGALVGKMRARIDALQNAQNELLDAAEANMEGMAQIHAAVLAMLEASSFRSFIRVVTEQFRDILQVDSARLCAETALGRNAPAPKGAEPLQALDPGTVDAVLGRGADYALRRASPDSARLHDHSQGEIESEALLRLDFGGDARPGLMVFGAIDPERFSEDQAADLLVFLAGAVGRAMGRWLDGALTK